MNLLIWQTIYILGGEFDFAFRAVFVSAKHNMCAAKSDASRRGRQNARKIRRGRIFRKTARYRRINRRRSRRANARNGFSGTICEIFGRERSENPFEWQVIGRSGITVKETIHELVPKIPDEKFDYILLAFAETKF